MKETAKYPRFQLLKDLKHESFWNIKYFKILYVNNLWKNIEILYLHRNPIFTNSFEMSDAVQLKLFFISTLKHMFFLLRYRFLFILLGPLGKGQQYHEIGRSMATLMTDEVFIQVHWEHFPLLGTPNFWSSVFMTIYCESDFSVLNPL